MAETGEPKDQTMTEQEIETGTPDCQIGCPEWCAAAIDKIKELRGRLDAARNNLDAVKRAANSHLYVHRMEYAPAKREDEEVKGPAK